MTKAQRKAVTEHRKRLKRRGIVRLEVRVPSAEAPLLRRIAEVLGDPERADALRPALVRAVWSDQDAKELLASMPLGDIDLRRSRDTGRKIRF